MLDSDSPAHMDVDDDLKPGPVGGDGIGATGEDGAKNDDSAAGKPQGSADPDLAAEEEELASEGEGGGGAGGEGEEEAKPGGIMTLEADVDDASLDLTKLDAAFWTLERISKIPVVCKSMRGLLDLEDQTVLCLCAECRRERVEQAQDLVFTPTGEEAAGCPCCAPGRRSRGPGCGLAWCAGGGTGTRGGGARPVLHWKGQAGGLRPSAYGWMEGPGQGAP